MELGDNPSVSGGAPLQIGWMPQDTIVYDVDMYEYCRVERRPKKKLVIPVEKRGQLLMNAGYTLNDIADAAMQVQQIKKERFETLQNQGWDRFNMILEASASIPKDVMKGVLAAPGGFLKKISKPRQNTLQSRAA